MVCAMLRCVALSCVVLGGVSCFFSFLKKSMWCIVLS